MIWIHLQFGVGHFRYGKFDVGFHTELKFGFEDLIFVSYLSE